MRMRWGILATALLAFVVAGCGGDDDGGPAGPGGGGNDDGPFRATIDGQPWSADDATVSVTGAPGSTREGLILITGYETATGRAVTLSLAFMGGPSTQPLGVNTGTTPGGLATVLVGSETWVTPFSGAAGFVTLTERTATRIAGTFNFTAAAQNAAMPATRVVTAGSFDITKATGLPGLPSGVGSTAIATFGGTPWYAATIVGISSGSGVFSLAADNTAYSLTLVPTQPVAAGNTYGIPSQMGLTVTRTGTTDSWWGGLGADVGSITITTLQDDRLVGTFNANLVPLNAVGGLAVGGGAINAYLLHSK